MNKRDIKIPVVIAFMLLAIPANAQNMQDKLDGLVHDFVTALQNKGVTKIGYAKTFCVGSYYIWDNENDRCEYGSIYYTVYLFWEDGDKAYAKKFDNCGAFNQIELPPTDFFNFYFSHREAIKTEEIKPYQTTQTEEDGSTRILTSVSIHSCHWNLVIYDGDEQVKKPIDMYDLSEWNEINESSTNINYEYNNGLKTVEWMNLTKEIIRQIVENGSFERNK